MEIKKINIHVKKFGILNSIRFICAERIRRFLDPNNIPSYSQTGEDRIIDIILGGEPGFYVDVGCNHPQRFSNTFFFYRRGWKEISIDANGSLIEKHQSLRKQDLSICAVISDKDQEVIFTEFNNSLVSSVSADHINKWKDITPIKEQRIVNTISLDSILQLHQAPQNFDLLSIDVEDHDFEVLRSLDLDIYRPRLIVIEMHGFDMEKPDSSKIYKHLKGNGYKMIGFAVMNGYFADVSPKFI